MPRSFKSHTMLTGGVILNMVFSKKVAGNYNNFGIMSPYIASYFYHQDSSVRNSDFTIVPGIASISEALTILLISYIIKYLKPFYAILSIGSLSCIAMILSSLIKNATLFCWVYGISLGMMSSTIFLPVIWILWNHIPGNRGKISGLMLASYSLGPVPFGLLFIYLTNPNNEKGDEIEPESKTSEKMFSEDVSDMVPNSIRITSAIFLTCLLIGLCMLPRNMNKTDQADNENEDIPILKILKNLKFWNLSILMLITSTGVIYLITVYKIIGLKYFNDDHFVSFIGIGAFISMTLGRIVYGVLFDKYKLKVIMILTYFCMAIIMFIFWFGLYSKVTYTIFIIIFNFFGGSSYNGLLLQCEKDFPNNKKVISLITLTSIPIYFSGFIFEKFVTPSIGYLFSFVVIGFFYIIAMIQMFAHSYLSTMKVGVETEQNMKNDDIKETEPNEKDDVRKGVEADNLQGK